MALLRSPGVAAPTRKEAWSRFGSGSCVSCCGARSCSGSESSPCERSWSESDGKENEIGELDLLSIKEGDVKGGGVRVGKSGEESDLVVKVRVKTEGKGKEWSMLKKMKKMKSRKKWCKGFLCSRHPPAHLW